MRAIRHDDGRLGWEGAVSVERTADWSQPWRIPVGERGLFPERLLRRADMPSGVRLAFRSETQSLAGRITPQADMTPMDLYVDGALQASLPMAGRDAFRFEGLPPGDKLLELWLPHWTPFQLRGLEMDDGADLRAAPDSRPRWITYGSSITHCRTASSPSFTWPAIAARARNLHLTSLGLAGQCHADPMIARVIRDLPARYLSVWIGINIHGSASMSERAFGPAIIGTIKTIRDGHPDTPLVVLSPILSPPRETTPSGAGLTLQAMREIMAASVAALQAQGDRALHYVSGLEILGPDEAGYLPDQLHPSAEGYRFMARRFLERVADRFFTP